jgi:hypothetical protein
VVFVIEEEWKVFGRWCMRKGEILWRCCFEEWFVMGLDRERKVVGREWGLWIFYRDWRWRVGFCMYLWDKRMKNESVEWRKGKDGMCNVFSVVNVWSF